MPLTTKSIAKLLLIACALASVAIGVVFTPSLTESTNKRQYVLTTGSTGGTFYPVGVALSTLIQAKLAPTHALSLSTVTSAGSGENISLLAQNQAQFAIINGLYGVNQQPLNQQANLLAVSMLWPNVEQYVIPTTRVVTGDISDLNHLTGATFSIGKKASGTERSGQTILTNLAIPVSSFKLTHTSYSVSTDALQDGLISGMNIPSGVPTPAINRAFASMGSNITMLNFTDEQLALVNKDFELWSRYVIAANTYPGQTQPIYTIAQPNFLAVRADVDEQDVYLLTKAIYQNLAFLHGIHPATKTMALEKAFSALPVPLHPGAARYYREAGLSIPAKLLTNQ
ncbi:TAXI family TRAP transporter solute-binding subunit [Endozoicomonas sp. G2_1]|uniref:TAXI family TRAP transporter solute-binding subunit n=1 Tax=Endozoicomonas sp. G2_1 TaxID=2821091 RepID=UPI001ADA3C39|nr:TAXI family TRAP transporter solute-binding subunit [Endozoicomonas sp. G2_1]MBO9490307.1 TAXI family TRAP transporter solute-binding subunit [Endozoicomonas sp. G2_1]